MKELSRQNEVNSDESVEPGATSIEIDSVSSMEEIELDLSGDLDGEVFDEDDADFDDEDDEEEEE